VASGIENSECQDPLLRIVEGMRLIYRRTGEAGLASGEDEAH
jgi:hypothetical protein